MSETLSSIGMVTVAAAGKSVSPLWSDAADWSHVPVGSDIVTDVGWPVARSASAATSSSCQGPSTNQSHIVEPPPSVRFPFFLAQLGVTVQSGNSFE